MGYIKEPVGVDLNIGSMPLSDEERQAVSAIIAQYKITGEVPKILSKTKVTRKKKISPSIANDRASAGKSKLKKKAIPASESGK